MLQNPLAALWQKNLPHESAITFFFPCNYQFWLSAVDPLGAQSEVLRTAAALGLAVTVSVAYEVQPDGEAMVSSDLLFVYQVGEPLEVHHSLQLCSSGCEPNL